MRLNVKAFALACAIFWGGAVFLVTWWVILLGGATGDPTWLGAVYLGYGISPVGSLIGLAWGLLSMLYFIVQAFGAKDFSYSPEIPHAAANT